MAAHPGCALPPRRCVTMPGSGRCRKPGLFDGGRIEGQATAVAIRAADTTALSSASSEGSGPHDSRAAGAHLGG